MKKCGLKYSTVIAIFLMAITAFSCKNSEEEIAKAYHKSNEPSEVTENLHVFVSKTASLEYEFSAPLLHVYHEPHTYQDTPKGFKLTTYTADKIAETEITALYGIYDEKKRVMEAKNTVVIKNLQTGEVIETEHLIWDINAHKIYSDTKIKQTKPDGSIYLGESFESGEDLSYYIIQKPQLIVYE